MIASQRYDSRKRFARGAGTSGRLNAPVHFGGGGTRKDSGQVTDQLLFKVETLNGQRERWRYLARGVLWLIFLVATFGAIAFILLSQSHKLIVGNETMHMTLLGLTGAAS